MVRAVLLILCLLWCACSEAGPALAEEEPVRIAAIFAKQGEAAVAGPYNYRGVQLAAAEINARGGVLGQPVEVVELDSESTPLGAAKAAMEAVELGVVGVVGATWSSLSLAMAPVLQSHGVPMIATMSSNPDVTLVGDYIFRVCYTDPFQGTIMAVFARRELQAESTVLLVNVSSDYAASLSENFAASFTKLGGSVLLQAEYKEDDADYAPMLEKVKALSPDTAFLPGYMGKASLIIKQAREMGIEAVFLGGDSWGSEMYEFAGAAVDGNYAAAGWHPEVGYPASRAMSALHIETYGEPPVDNTVMAYDATMVLADAVARAGSTDREAVRNALAQTKDFPGASGRITFDANGDPLDKDAVVQMLKEGKMVYQMSVKP